MKKSWDNENRKRYYGFRIGDIVDCSTSSLKQFHGEAEIIAYGGSDNNAVYTKKTSHKESIRCVAEWLNLVTKVEDRSNSITKSLHTNSEKEKL
jgi:hypothetical protein